MLKSNKFYLVLLSVFSFLFALFAFLYYYSFKIRWEIYTIGLFTACNNLKIKEVDDYELQKCAFK